MSAYGIVNRCSIISYGLEWVLHADYFSWIQPILILLCFHQSIQKSPDDKVTNQSYWIRTKIPHKFWRFQKNFVFQFNLTRLFRLCHVLDIDKSEVIRKNLIWPNNFRIWSEITGNFVVEEIYFIFKRKKQLARQKSVEKCYYWNFCELWTFLLSLFMNKSIYISVSIAIHMNWIWKLYCIPPKASIPCIVNERKK